MDLAKLPREILCNIFVSGLSRRDIKSVRLTCRELAAVAAPLLFQRISISPLRRDRSSFFNIAKTFPHLVRVVIWEELNGDLDQFDPSYYPDDRDPYLPSFFRELASEARGLFWTEPGSAHSEFLHEFQQAIANMSNLHTLASKLMHPRREVILPTLGYTINVDMIMAIIRKQGIVYTYNTGFINFIIPTMEVLTNPSSLSIFANQPPTVTRLFYADDGIAHFTALTRITESNGMAFSTLRHLDLCIGGVRCDARELRGLLTCLRNARNLTSFKLCQENSLCGDPSVEDLLSIIPTLPSLTELHLADLDLNDNQYTKGFVKFISRHAKTLKRVYLTSVSIKKWALPKLAAMELLQLKRFVVVSKLEIDETTEEDFDDIDKDYDEALDTVLHEDFDTFFSEHYNGEFFEKQVEHISEQVVLDYINGKNDPNGERLLPPYGIEYRNTELHTHDAIFDIDTWRTAAICDTRDDKWMERGYDPMVVQCLDFEMRDQRDEHGIAYDIGARRIKDPATSLWIDSNGVLYNPATDEEMDDTDGRSYEPEDESWITQGRRTWNSELGLWRDGTTGRLEKFAIDREILHKPGAHGCDEWRLDFPSQEPAEGSEIFDMRPFYANEEDEYCLRAEMAPRWDWGRDPTGKVWFWQASGIEGHATEVWYFEHKGERAYGHEPLDFWHDWRERNEPESMAEATPYGWNLLNFVADKTMVGSEIPQPGLNDSLSKYRKRDDPMRNEFDLDRLLPVPADFEMHSKKKWIEADELI
ncbi:hypothetical protein ACHAPQ_008936 [Fusarium lateritium]